MQTIIGGRESEYISVQMPQEVSYYLLFFINYLSAYSRLVVRRDFWEENESLESIVYAFFNFVKGDSFRFFVFLACSKIFLNSWRRFDKGWVVFCYWFYFYSSMGYFSDGFSLYWSHIFACSGTNWILSLDYELSPSTFSCYILVVAFTLTSFCLSFFFVKQHPITITDFKFYPNFAKYN